MSLSSTKCAETNGPYIGCWAGLLGGPPDIAQPLAQAKSREPDDRESGLGSAPPPPTISGLHVERYPHYPKFAVVQPALLVCPLRVQRPQRSFWGCAFPVPREVRSKNSRSLSSNWELTQFLTVSGNYVRSLSGGVVCTSLSFASIIQEAE